MDILFSPIRLNELELLIEKSVLKVLQKPLPPPPPQFEERYINKVELKKVLGDVSNPTIWDWEKKGFLKGYRMGRLTMYKLSEVLSSPKFIERTKK